MPKLPGFGQAQSAVPARRYPLYLVFFFALFTVPLVTLHYPILNLPFFWDEHGQFIPTALDLLRTGAWIAHSTIPNVHPPGVEAYLVLWYRVFGFSIVVTRIAMLLLAGAGLLFTFLLAIELSRNTEGAPAFLPPLLLFASPLFYMQSMMAQLDMPEMVLTLLALLLFIRRDFAWAATVSVALVLVKETGIVAPAVFFGFLLWERNWRAAAYFVVPALALGAWLLMLHHATSYWLGNPGFAHYNVEYSLHPVRIVLSLARRIYYLFFAEFRWVGSLALLFTIRKTNLFSGAAWRVTLAVSTLTLLLVSVLGGAELERYLLPVLPVFYIAVSIGLTTLRKWIGFADMACLLGGLIVNLFWNPPYPFPYENNYAMVDFVRLQQAAGAFAERFLQGQTIATAWPYSAALESSDYGFVDGKLKVVETNDFHASSIETLPRGSFDALITYTRTWMPANGVISWPPVRRFLQHFYEWEPDITPAQCRDLGLRPVASWQQHGQQITVYVRPRFRPGSN